MVSLQHCFSPPNTFIAPSWIVKQSIELARKTLLLEQEDFQARLDKARQKEESVRRMNAERARKRQVPTQAIGHKIDQS